MIVCPNCTHQNPDGATQCEACYTPLPTTTSCPNCGTPVQTDAGFCGQCGFNLKPTTSETGGQTPPPDPFSNMPGLATPDPLVTPATLVSQPPDPGISSPHPPAPDPASPLPATVVSQASEPISSPPTPDPVVSSSSAVSSLPPTPDPVVSSSPAVSSLPPTPPPVSSSGAAKTQLQLQASRLLHVQTNTLIELPQDISVIHVGKPNEQIPPDIDVSGFPNSEIVSRVHADIRVEGDAYYIEDVGSANGTYVNHNPLPRGNRHKLRAGDRISLGKGDLMTFLFQLS